MKGISIRPEEAADAATVYLVNKAAFRRRDEADLVNALRESGETLISLVAVVEGRLVGHIVFSPVTVEAEDMVWRAVALGPVAVLPEAQGQGVGSRMIQAGLAACHTAGHEVVFVLGHDEYYPRFGFRPTKPLGIRWEHDAPEEAFMVLELTPGALDGRQGIVKYAPAFG